MTGHRTDLVDYAARLLGDRTMSEDLVQEAYLRFATRAPARLSEPFGYLKRIVRNLALDTGRRQGRERKMRVADDIWENLPDHRPDPETIVADRERVRLVLRAVEALPPRTRRALELYRLEQRTLQEVADEMKISVSTAHGLVRKGLIACSRALDGEHE
ncbi:sigma-70 family RNA polymerase sigma factor [Celeribacter indicus]|uniref:RNA polymerase sigma-70 family protein n=1 Tax=Celeribacter indicus TaxID=1208324 RepID=A0A0B5DRZ7_9RHOB|nr:sigma-70 family RNA polymerase sigma factor [Celeribacter indicus]AJE45814.1 RNA polymerase sigma-70 family protein [Celeribacter indicus]SDW61312.1 RNA polymerase sigma-70 factor, ECF subfamily [Celeribacter indicus]